MAETSSADLQSLTADIVAAYVSNNKIGGAELGKLVSDTYRALGAAGAPPSPGAPEEAKPDKTAIRKSVSPDYLVSFLDGRQYKSLKRHLTTQGTSPDEYRARFGLAKDYPMVASNYSAQRSALAKTLGLGRRTAEAPASSELESVEEPEAATPKARRARASKAEAEASS